MTFAGKPISRRMLLQLAGLGFCAYIIPPGCKQNRVRSTDPQNVLNDLKENRTIGMLRSGQIIFMHKSVEGLSPRGKEAFAIIQRGLIALQLMPPIQEHEYGVYGDKTAKGINHLQDLAEMDRVQGWDGRKFDAETLNVLEAALQHKIDGRWVPPKDF
jgi:hypothetical protein